MTSDPQREPVQTADFIHILNAIRRQWVRIVLATFLAGLATYFISRSRPVLYQASASMMAVRGDSGNSLINSTLVTPPPLPTGALQEALRSPDVINEVLLGLRKTTLVAETREKLKKNLTREMKEGRFTSLALIARIDEQKTGIYELVAKAATPAAAATLADLTVKELINWDLNRSNVYISRARLNMETQYRSVNAQLAALTTTATPAKASQRQRLTVARDAVARDLAQLRILEGTSVGTLTQVRQAIEPVTPVSPRPLRDTALVMALVALLGLLLTTALDGLRPRPIKQTAGG